MYDNYSNYHAFGLYGYEPGDDDMVDETDPIEEE